VWHDVSIVNPDAATLMYACVTDGCPDKGELVMRCKQGYGGPLCAVCDDGYFVQVRKCVECKEPHWGAFFAFLVCVLALGLVAVRYSGKYKRYLDMTQTFAHFKIFVGWVTVMSTVNSQFGVVWPASFARALDGLSVLSFDFGVLAGMFCITSFNYYQGLLCSTLFLVSIVCIILIPARVYKRTWGVSMERCVFAAVYVALFAYPVVSVKIVQIFACHEIAFAGGQASVAPAAANVSVASKTFVRADYSLECGTAEWTAMAAYAGLWLVAYVIVFPAYIIHQLLTCYYRNQHHDVAGSWGGSTTSSLFDSMDPLDDSMGGDSMDESEFPAELAPPRRKERGKTGEHAESKETRCRSKLYEWWRRVAAGVAGPSCGHNDLVDGREPMLSFLADDYRPGMPFWEALEMVRKLLLSVLGAFWSNQSTMCVATAVLISAFFQLLHSSYCPYKSNSLNRLQQLSLTVLTLTYFIGVLLKTQTLFAEDADNVGTLMLLLVFAVFSSVIAAVVLEVHELRKWKREIKYAKQLMDRTMEFDSALQTHVIDYLEIKLGKVTRTPALHPPPIPPHPLGLLFVCTGAWTRCRGCGPQGCVRG
jgi:hypothetical protein